MQIDQLQEGACKKLEEMNAIQRKLQEMEDDIAKLNQKILSQKALLHEQGEDLLSKKDLLSNLSTTNQKLVEALEQRQEYKVEMKSCEIEARYHQKHREELHSNLLQVCVLV